MGNIDLEEKSNTNYEGLLFVLLKVHKSYPASDEKPLEYFKKHSGFTIIFLPCVADLNNNLKDGFGHGVRTNDR